MNQRPAPAPYMPEPKSGAGKKILLVILIIVIIALLGVGGVLAYLSFMTQPVVPANDNVNQSVVANENVNAEENLNINEDLNTNEALNENINVAPPIPMDSDNDGLSDTDEATLGTNPNLADTDADGLNDRDEIYIYQTDALNPDTDGDTYLDGEEVQNGYNPKGPGKLLVPPTQ
jgi:hypothetical protein